MEGQSVMEDVMYDRHNKMAILDVAGSDDGNLSVCRTSNFHDLERVSISNYNRPFPRYFNG